MIKGVQSTGGNLASVIKERNRRMQQKISTIIATDFLCWIPFAIVCCLHATEIVDATSWYGLFSLVILPINSVINPLLYDKYVTDAIGFLYDGIQKHFDTLIGFFSAAEEQPGNAIEMGDMTNAVPETKRKEEAGPSRPNELVICPLPDSPQLDEPKTAKTDISNSVQEVGLHRPDTLLCTESPCTPDSSTTIGDSPVGKEILYCTSSPRTESSNDSPVQTGHDSLVDAVQQKVVITPICTSAQGQSSGAISIITDMPEIAVEEQEKKIKAEKEPRRPELLVVRPDSPIHDSSSRLKPSDPDSSSPCSESSPDASTKSIPDLTGSYVSSQDSTDPDGSRHDSHSPSCDLSRPANTISSCIESSGQGTTPSIPDSSINNVSRQDSYNPGP